ncbi:LemA family protein [Candidatus Pacearchaeota archaeon]|nr:LemA family protein [Candidatus Pacearchaeota archaeon]
MIPVLWIGLVVAGLIVLLIFMFVMYYNRFVVLDNRIDNSLAQIDVQLKKRADLVPNLLETVKGYMKHEKSIIKSVTDARQAMMSASNLPDRAKAGADLQTALRSVFAISENYPQLKANEGFVQLQQDLSAIEDKIAYARQFYNDAIVTYNNSVETFPGVMFANLWHKKPKPQLTIKEEEKAVPKVQF